MVLLQRRYLKNEILFFSQSGFVLKALGSILTIAKQIVNIMTTFFYRILSVKYTT